MTEPVAAAVGGGEEQCPTTAAWVVAKLREGHGIVGGSDRARATADLIEELEGRVAARDEAWARTIRAALSGVGVIETPAEPTPEAAQSMRRQVGEHLLALHREAVATERARVKAAVEGLVVVRTAMPGGSVERRVDYDDVLAAIDGEGA